jgi:NADP-dependent 3-hydroxy acid dehydrogenase YdfG
MIDKPLSEQTALITGGATGIGRAFAEALLDAGVADVVIASRRKETLDQASREMNIKYGGRVRPFAFDIRDRSRTEALVDYAGAERGAIDILINNSGLAVPETVNEITGGGWDTVLETNLRGAMWLIQLVLPGRIERSFGDIVNVASQAGKHGYSDVPSYCASKFGLLGLAESVRDDLRKRRANVRVFNVCPGLVDVETPPGGPPREGSIGTGNMARTLLFMLSLDRNVVLEDINIYAG